MRCVKILFILLFLSLLALPAAQRLTGFVRVPPVDEKRQLAALPLQAPLAGCLSGPAYADAVETWFSDHFPLRDLALRTLGQFEYSALGRAKEVVVGSDGWLCDKTVLIKQLPALDRMTDAQLLFGIQMLMRLRAHLASRGIDLLVVIVPMKPTIYPEKFPALYTKRPARIALERFQDMMAQAGIDYVDVLGDFRAHKDGPRLYYKTDMHWNLVGSARAARLIVRNLAARYKVDVALRPDFGTIEEQPFSGGELATMPLLFPREETTPFYSDDQNFREWREDTPENFLYFTGTDAAQAKLPKMRIFGNSFMLNYGGVGLHNYFEESSRVLDYQYFKKVLDYLPGGTRTVMMHLYETQLLFHVLDPGAMYWDPRLMVAPNPAPGPHAAQ